MVTDLDAAVKFAVIAMGLRYGGLGFSINKENPTEWKAYWMGKLIWIARIKGITISIEKPDAAQIA